MLPKALWRVKSVAEQRVFHLLEKVDTEVPTVCFHSLHLPEHDYKLVGEADFVILSRYGLYVLEVKGGRVFYNDGLWEYRDRFDRFNRTSHGPFEQAESAMFAIRNRLAERFAPHDLDDLHFGFGVVFPDSDFPVETIECPRSIVLDAARLRDNPGMERYIRELMNFWRGKARERRTASDDLVQRIGKYLRPNFDVAPSLSTHADALDTVMEALTDRQYTIVDAVRRAPRILCEGGAGTGKTYVAAEIARREAAPDRKVLFVCRSPVLSAFVSSRINSEHVTVSTLEDLETGRVALPVPADVLIVDEGQDILNPPHLDFLETFVLGGLRAGKWRIFFDPNNQSGIYESYDPEAVELLVQYGAVPVALSENCRNTVEIVQQTQLMTGADLGVACAGSGPQVTYKDCKGPQQVPEKLAEHLEHLSSQGVQPGDITLLSPLPFPDSSAAALPRTWLRKITVVDPAVAAQFPLRKISFSTIEDFKGLENRFIAVTDLAGVNDTPRDLSLLYVAMSRARTALWISVTPELRAQLTLAGLQTLSRVAPKE